MSNRIRGVLFSSNLLAILILAWLNQPSFAQRYPYYIQDASATWGETSDASIGSVADMNQKGTGVGTGLPFPGASSGHALITMDGITSDMTPAEPSDYVSSAASAINDLGCAVGAVGATANPNYVAAFLFNPASTPSLTDIQSNGIVSNGQIVHSNVSSAWAINNRNQVVGTFEYPGTDFTHAFIYDANSSNPRMKDVGEDINLLLNDTQNSYPLAINDKGQAVIQYANMTFVYDSAKNSLTQLASLPTGNYVNGFDINSKGQVVGSSNISDGFNYHDHAVLHFGGTVTDINGALPNNATSSIAKTINDSGQLAGTCTSTLGQSRGFLYSGGVAKDIGPNQQGPLCLNNRGQVYGDDAASPGCCLYSGGARTNIDSLIYPNLVSLWDLREWDLTAYNMYNGAEGPAQCLNDSGQIIGLGTRAKADSDGSPIVAPKRAFVMTPFPWKTAAGGSWGDVNNWKNNDGYATEDTSLKSVPGMNGTDPIIGDTATFGDLVGNTSPVVTLDGERVVSCIAFNNALNNSQVCYTITPGTSIPSSKLIMDNRDYADEAHTQSLNLSAMIVVAAGNHTIAAPIQLNSSLIVESLPGTQITISGQMLQYVANPPYDDPNKSLTKTREGTLTLSGSNAYTGHTLVEGGILELDTNGQIDHASQIATEHDGIFQIKSGSHVVGPISGDGETRLLASTSLTADSVCQRIITLGTGSTLTIAALPDGPQTVPQLFITGTVDLGGATMTTSSLVIIDGNLQNGTLLESADHNFFGKSGVVSACLAGNVGLTKTTSGTLTLSGSNTYTGDTILCGGTLEFTSGIAQNTTTILGIVRSRSVFKTTDIDNVGLDVEIGPGGILEVDAGNSYTVGRIDGMDLFGYGSLDLNADLYCTWCSPNLTVDNPQYLHVLNGAVAGANMSVVPEPATCILLLVGLVCAPFVLPLRFGRTQNKIVRRER
jgi:autotransporter-associated beta strand protein